MESGGAVEGAARLLTVPFGAPATDALWATIRAAKGADALAPVTVIVPGNLTGLALRRELGGRGDGLFNVRFFVLDRLAELLGAGVLAAQGRTPLDDAVKAALVRKVLASGPAPLTRVAQAENTELAVVEMLDELAASGPDAVGALRSRNRRGNALAGIATSFRSLAEASFYDEHDLALAAAGVIRDGSGDLRDVGQVVLHLPHRLGHAQLDLVDALAEIDRVWAIVGLTGEADTDTDALALGAHLEPRLGTRVAVGASVEATTTKVTAPDAVGEVREAMRIVAAELEAGRPLNRIAIVYRQSEPYARIIDEELMAAGIPMNGPAVGTVAQSVAGRTLLGALALADDDFARPSVVRWMSSSPLRVEGGFLKSAAWARSALKAGVVRGPAQWTDRLGEQALDTDAPLLAEYVAWLVEECGVDSRESWAAWADWARGFLVRTLGSAPTRRRWPEPELVAFDAVERTVEGLRSLVDVEPGSVTRQDASSHLAAMLSRPGSRRGSFGRGVLCGPLRHVIGVDLDAIVVLGMAEGVFPPSGVDSAVLSSAEREAVGSPRAQEARAREERRTYLAALGSAPRRWLSSPRAASGQVAHEAPWLTNAVGEQVVLASFDAELAAPVGPPASLHERDLRVLRATDQSQVSRHPLVEADAGLARGFTAIEARMSPEFTEFDGNVGAHDALAIADIRLSATALQTWAECPAHYFFKQVLRVRELDRVGDVDELEARHRGSLVHLVLERLGREHLERYQAHADQLQLEIEQVPWTETAREVVERVTGEVFQEFERAGSAPYEILWDVEKRRIIRDVLRTLDTDVPGARLIAVEDEFGTDERPFSIEIADGRTLHFKGKIDRVDRVGQRLRVIDYKTGKSASLNDVRAGIASGTLLQLPLYGLAALAAHGPAPMVSAGYWYVSSKGGWKPVMIDIDDKVQDRFRETLDIISTGIGDGVFPAHPGEESWLSFESCQWCEYDRICPADRDRAWHRLDAVPELEAYRKLREPIAAPEADDD